MMKRALIRTACAVALAAFLPAAVLAQDAYPNKPIKLVVPFPPAGGTDVLSRSIAQSMASARSRRPTATPSPWGRPPTSR